MLSKLLSWLGLGRAAPRPQIPDLTPQEAQARLKGGALLLDVRTPAERQALAIPGSRSVPLGQLPAQMDKLPRQRALITQCASGNRSRAAAQLLAAQGYEVYNLKGGIHAWQAAGLPTRRG
ncbi:rhodanese-like domain-containing protein [Deinococcus aluminii]|uniref:Thiosulfate sulfurtransferase GlpE n=1 Tax=Deinococcus aluminii TaxID=1656885 RepID=A0ABP9XHI8_9DEIO